MTVPAALTLPRRLLTGTEFSPPQVCDLFRLTAEIKARPADYRSALSGGFLAMIFEKPSLRTRVTFGVGIAGLGGGAVLLDHTGTRLGARESVPDTAIVAEAQHVARETGARIEVLCSPEQAV